MSPDNRDNTGTISTAQQMESLISGLRQFSDRQPESQAYRLLAETVASELQSVARRGGGYGEARQVIQSHQQLAALWGSALGDMLANLERSEQARIRREIYSSSWWAQTVETLRQAFDKDPGAAYQQWLGIYAQALVDWELETCDRLVSVQFSYPRDQYPYTLLIRHGTAALREQAYRGALTMLDYLVERLSDAAENLRLLAALLSIFVGRIQLYQAGEPDLAGAAFDRAVWLAERDGRPQAAFGHLALARTDADFGEANRRFSRAVEASPDQPEGYVGKAMIAEKRGQWGEADEWYSTAVKESLDERDLLQFLSKMLAPGSGRLYLHAARQLLADGAPDRALAAVDHCLEIGMEDGSSYPTRSAIVLKADILLAKSGAERTPEEAQTIADLYFDAGKDYFHNNELSTAVDLMNKCHDLDGHNSLALFHKADALMVLSGTATPPYADEKLARESLAAWEDGFAIAGKAVGPDNAWVYASRARIAKRLATLPGEDYKEQYWQAILFDELALLLAHEYPFGWTDLSNSYNGLELYANMLYALQEATKANPDDSYTLQERAKVLINTGQFREARTALDKLLQDDKVGPTFRPMYQSWQAVVDHYLGDYSKALEDLEPSLQQNPDDLWGISLRANIYRAMGDDRAAMKDEIWIWDRRQDPNYEAYKTDFAWSAFWQSKFLEAIDRIEPFVTSMAADERNNAQLLAGLSHLALGEIEKGNEFLSLALETCDNPRVLADLVTELEQLQQRVSQGKWRLGSAVASYLDKPGGILKQAKSKQRKMKSYKVDPVKELEKVLTDPATGKAGSSSWLAAQFGLGRLHLEAKRLKAAEKAYGAVSAYAQEIPEADVGLKKVQEQIACA